MAFFPRYDGVSDGGPCFVLVDSDLRLKFSDFSSSALLGEARRVGSSGRASAPRHSGPRESIPREGAPATAADREEKRQQRTIRDAKDSRQSGRRGRPERDQSAPPPSRYASTGPSFDFSKPYESTPKVEAAPKVSEPAPGSKKPAGRKIGALLGGKKAKAVE